MRQADVKALGPEICERATEPHAEIYGERVAPGFLAGIHRP
ncbi:MULTISPECIES: hypothetical protein [Streptomyces]|nr:hypothetical protein [Streptomyces scabiei]MDX3113448.1 hypothetical protein [Streptomyces scabiei]